MSQQPWSGPQYAPPRGGSQPGSPAYGPYGSARGWPPPGVPTGGGYYQGYSSPGFGRPSFGGGVPQYGPAPFVPAPRRRNPLRMLLGVIIIVTLVAIAGLAIVGLTPDSSTAAYQNDDYPVPPPDTNPPPIPLPQTYEEAEEWITKSPFYNQTVPAPVRCNSQPINVATASDAQLKAHFEGLIECLVRVWEPPVTNAGYIIVRPTVTIYGEELTTKCGRAGINAFYCTADQQVYYSRLLPQALPTVRRNKWTADIVMAHEFGHALQGRTGILVSAHALGQESGQKSTELQFTRRLETQADCFSGMFIRAVSESMGVQQQDLPGILDIYLAIGDDSLSGDPNIVGNHGLGRSREYWGNMGLANSAVGNCNTFIVESRLVR
ncbi:MAG TPA: neutral zinc metallopeptidase [Propionibacteriaceae bacterium]|nr:neutral zinc metallopeptidase [Propionibacteriaceae bacterium]